MNYYYMFQKGSIGNVTLKNRIVMPTMGTNQSNADGELNDQQIRYYEERARGGTGLIIVEITSIEYELGQASATHPRIDHDKYTPRIAQLARAIHKYDAKVFMQLHHAGDKSNTEFTNGNQIVSPSGVMRPAVTSQPRALTREEVKDLVNKFVQGAVRCKKAGIDGVELHGAHSYLIAQFLSPLTNKRTDEYGGSFENRLRFLTEIVQGIKQACGHDYPVMVRLSGDEFLEGGIDLEETKKISIQLEKIGVDALHISAGTYETVHSTIEPASFSQGWKVYLAEAVKKVVSIPVITVGNIREPAYVESILREEKADLVAIGRGLIADPEWVNKVRGARERELNKCISCLYCIESISERRQSIACAINARAGRELEFEKFESVGENRHVVVVGGGPAGMEAARVLALKGYGVTLFEKKSQLGGQLLLANKAPRKEKIDWLLDYYKNEMERLEIDVRLKTEATIDEIEKLFPFAIILATGAKNTIPFIKGSHLPNVYTFEDVLMARKEFTNRKIAVIGAGMTGCETAEFLAINDNDVSLIEMTDTIGTGIGLSNRIDILRYLEKNNVQLMPNHKLLEIRDKEIVLENLKTVETVIQEVDNVILSMGVTSYNPLEEMLHRDYPNVFVIGDAKEPGKIADAVRDGFEKAFVLESIILESGGIPAFKVVNAI